MRTFYFLIAILFNCILISQENKGDYKIIFDECGDFENLIVDYFSFQIDNNILQFSSDQVFKLQEIENENANANANANTSKERDPFFDSDIEMEINNINEKICEFDNFMENEFIELNGFSRIFLGILIIFYLFLMNFIR